MRLRLFFAGMSISEQDPLGILIKTSLVDYPGRVAATLFLPGCNLRCPYCYNGELVQAGNSHKPMEAALRASFASLSAIEAHLKKRRQVLSGFVISGGEALLHPEMPALIAKAKSLGYAVKLDTNGTLPRRLYAIVSNPESRPDFIAMDLKTSPHRYCELLPQGSGESSGGSSDFSALLHESVAIMTEYFLAENREWRTVLVPPLVRAADIKNMAALLPADASWKFAQFRNDNCLQPSFNSIQPYSALEAENLVAYAKTLIAGSALR